jgi:site-specific recombinase XerD
MSGLPNTGSIPHSNGLALTSPTPLTLHPVAVYLSSLGHGSRRAMNRALNAIASMLTNGQCDAMTLDWSKLRYHHTAAVRAVLIEKYSPATVNKWLSALRRVLEEAKRLDLMSVSDYKSASDLRSVPVTKGLKGRALKRGEIAALIGVCQQDSSPIGVRDAALIAILRGAGLRRQELANLNLNDFDSDTGAIEVKHAKGGKDRTVYLSTSATGAVLNWLEVRGNAPGPLLSAISRGHRVLNRRLTAQAVLFILQKRAKQAGVETFSAHDFRRTYISDLLDAGVDIVTVQKLAGHNDPATTSRYDRRGEETKRLASELLDFPGV